MDVDRLLHAEGTFRGVIRTVFGISGNVQVRELLIGSGSGVSLSGAPVAQREASPRAQAVVFTSAAQIRALRQLPPEGAQAELHGVITFYDPHWHTLFFQDRTAGIFLHCPGFCRVEAGRLVEVRGSVTLSGFAPMVENASFRGYGAADMPPPLRPTTEELFSGRFDSQRVEAEGVIQSVEHEYQHLLFTVASGLYRFRVHVPYPEHEPLPVELTDAKVRIRGVAGSIFTPRRQLTGILLYAPSLADIRVLARGDITREGSPVRNIGALLRFSPDQDWNHAVRVQGTVLYQHLRSRELFIDDGTGGVVVQTARDQKLEAGDRVDVRGFATSTDQGPVLRDASYVKMGRGQSHAGHRTRRSGRSLRKATGEH